MATTSGAVITDIHWTWGDSTTTSNAGFPASHTYGAPGTYLVRVTATDSDGLSATATVEVTVRRTPKDPGKVAAPTATPGDASATVTWAAPTTGGSPITTYTVVAEPSNRTCTWRSGPLRCTVTELNNGTRYTFTVTAHNAVGAGPASAPSNPVVPAGDPGRPQMPHAVAGSASATVTWGPATAQGSRITSYTVVSTPGAKTCTWTYGPLHCTVLGLTDGTPYTFTVTARNAIGAGPPSAKSNTVVPGQ